MAQLIVLKGKNETLDLTRYIPVGNYNINDITNYDEWIDSNYAKHRQKTDTKAEGDFTLRFPSINLYKEFVEFIERNEDEDTGAIDCDVFCTNKFKVKSISAFLDFAPPNDLPFLADHKSNGFTVELFERG